VTTPAALAGEPIHARGHSTATLYEAAHADDARRRTAGQGQDLGAWGDIALDPSLCATWPGARVDGPAFTVQGAGGDNLALHHAVAAAPPGHVLVADLGGAPFGHWGEVLAVAARARHLTGLVIDGGVRDIDAIRELGFPVFSRNNSVRGTSKLFQGRLGADVTVAGAVVRSGDLVVGDSDGVVALPRPRVGAVLDEADTRVASEREIMTAIRAGCTTLDLYRLP